MGQTIDSIYQNPKWKAIDDEFAEINEQAEKYKEELEEHNSNYVEPCKDDIEF